MRGRPAAVLLAVVAAILPVAIAASAKNPPNDNQIEKQAVLKKSDLPSGWSSEPRDTWAPPAIPVCAGMRGAAAQVEPISADSPDFVKSEVTRAQNSVVVMKTANQARSILIAYRDPDATACYEALVKKAFDDPTLASVRVTVTPGDDAPRGADEAVTFDIAITATTTPTPTQPSTTSVIYFDVLFARVGRAATNFVFMDLGEPLAERDEMVDAVIGRLQNAGV